MIADVEELAEIVGHRIPDLDPPAARQFAATALMMSGVVWTHAHPSDAMRTACACEPELAALGLDFGATLSGMLDVHLVPLVRTGARFENGLLVERSESHAA